jgi:hypothetical protein
MQIASSRCKMNLWDASNVFLRVGCLMSTFAYFSVWPVLAFDFEISSSVDDEYFKMELVLIYSTLPRS